MTLATFVVGMVVGAVVAEFVTIFAFCLFHRPRVIERHDAQPYTSEVGFFGSEARH